MKERVINLTDLVLEILLHWRGIIVLMLTGGIILGTFSFIQSYRNISNSEQSEGEENNWDLILESADSDATLIEVLGAWEEEDEDLEKNVQKWLGVDESELHQTLISRLEEELSQMQINNVMYTLYYEDLYHEKEIYQEQSILMQMDPDKVYRAELTFAIVSEDLEHAYNIEKVYEDFARSTELHRELAEIADTSVPYIEEIYSLARSSSGLQNGCDSFKVTMVHSDKDVCQAFMDAVIQYINEKYEEIEQDLPLHEIKLIDSSIGEEKNISVLNMQRETQRQLLELHATFENRKTSFTDEWYYYNLLKADVLSAELGEVKSTDTNVSELDTSENELDSKQHSDENMVAVPKPNWKYVVSGMLFLPLCYILIIYMKYVLGKKLCSANQMRDLFDIPLLGVIPNAEKGGKKQKIFAFVDHWIFSLFQQDQRINTLDDNMNLIAATIKWNAEKENLDKVCLVGYNLKGQEPELYAQMTTLLKKEKITMETFDNALHNVESVKKLRESQNVILLEKIGVSEYKYIEQDVELLKQQEIRILGGIVVE